MEKSLYVQFDIMLIHSDIVLLASEEFKCSCIDIVIDYGLNVNKCVSH